MDYTDLNSTTSTWNTTYKIAVPTQAFVKSITDIDATLEGDDSEAADRKILGLTLQAKNFLFETRSKNDRKVLEYKIAFEEEYRLAWIIFATRYIEATFILGDEIIWKEVPRAVLSSINSSALNRFNFTSDVVYQVENSEETW